ncbi:mCG145921, partial [Mus musculus]
RYHWWHGARQDGIEADGKKGRKLCKPIRIRRNDYGMVRKEEPIKQASICFHLQSSTFIINYATEN